MGASDVFLNLAGGIRLGDPGIDLAVVGAILSSTLDLTLDPKTALCGEVGLTGEVRPVARLEQRMMEAAKLGMKRLVVSGLAEQGGRASERARAHSRGPRGRAAEGPILTAYRAASRPPRP